MLLAAWLISGCAPQPEISPGDRWLYANLRTVEAPSEIDPSFDLVAAYTRLAGGDLQIRLDLLELDPLPSFDLYLALDTGPGGRRELPFQAESDLAWDTLLYLPASAPTSSFQSGAPGSPLVSNPRLIPRIVRYPWLDALVVSLNANNLNTGRPGFNLQAFLVAPGGGTVIDTLGPLPSEARPPGRAPLLLAFWNTFPAYSPAQALRRWDGAHTGPYGERHGLHLLLQAVRRSKVPVVLLDLKTPAALSALDYLGKLPQIQNLAAQGLLILPEALPGSPGFPYFPSGLPDWAWVQTVADSRQAGLNFGLRGSLWLYTPVIPENTVPEYPFIFTQLQSVQPASWKGRTILPVPLPGDDPQMDQDGLSQEIRAELLRNAAASGGGRQQAPPVILGGSLPDHPLGDPQAAESVFNYIAAHPWIQPLSEADLETLHPAASPEGFARPVQAPYSPVLKELPAPANPAHLLEQAAWQEGLSLYSSLPPEPEQLAQLRTLYSGQPGLILAASDWASDPAAIQDCSTDPDQDGQMECLLADSKTLAVIDPLGGRLIMLFTRRELGLHQLVAPVSQLITGLSDPSEWNLERGEAAEAPGLQGAFADTRTFWQIYKVELLPGEIHLISPDGQVRKSFQLTPTGLRVEYRSAAPAPIDIPIAIDPWQRFQTGWAEYYRLQELSDGFAWQLGDSERLEVRASTGMQAVAFTDSHPQLNLAENPNFNYPPGHYLPFPLVVLQASAPDGFTVDFSVIEK